MISIIIPCYNSEKYIKDAIDSVKNQSYKNWECIIVNDGSTDNSETIIQDCIKNDNRFLYIKQENKGPGAARNYGAKYVKGELMTMLDADDILGKYYLENAQNFFDNNPKYCLYYGMVEHFDESGKIDLVYPKPLFYWSIFIHNVFNTTCVYHTKDFKSIGGYNEELDNKEDWEFYIRLLYRNRPFYVDKNVLAFKYRHHKHHRDKGDVDFIYYEKIKKLNPEIFADYEQNIH